jgi:hypothetical protein
MALSEVQAKQVSLCAEKRTAVFLYLFLPDVEA